MVGADHAEVGAHGVCMVAKLERRWRSRPASLTGISGQQLLQAFPSISSGMASTGARHSPLLRKSALLRAWP